MNWKYLHKIKRKRKLLHTFYFLQSTDFSVRNNKKSWSDFCLLINYEWVGCCAAVGSLKTRLNLPLVFFKEILDTWDVFISILFFLFKWMYAASWSFSQVKCSPRGNHTMSSRCVYHVLSHNTVSRLNSIKNYQETSGQLGSFITSDHPGWWDSEGLFPISRKHKDTMEWKECSLKSRSH